MARSLYRLPHSVSFGVRAVFSTLFFMTICSRSTLEEAKHQRRRDFGLLIGTGSAPCVKGLAVKTIEDASLSPLQDGSHVECGHAIAGLVAPAPKREWVFRPM